ncbi:148aa long hypothetical protein [Pyrococcus horikoshii OT3]|uniref:CDC48 domain-containing protein n=3 Tax=Pyrococcus horikoshii TaxID=53953 RepID=O59169_PYRHO|nr:148aa long hypothetical protein [Pyrococcus horikoshii OT3]
MEGVIMSELKLKPLPKVELPPDFVDVIRIKLQGKTVRTGDVIGISILGKEVKFKVVQAYPSPLRVEDRTKITLVTHPVDVLEAKIKGIKDVILDENLIVVITEENEVLIFNQNLEELYRGKFENLNKVLVRNDLVVIIDEQKLTLIRT